MIHPHWRNRPGPQGQRCLLCGYIGEHTKEVCDGRAKGLETLKRRAGLQ